MFHRFSTWWRALSVVLLSLATVTWPTAARAGTTPAFGVEHQGAVAALSRTGTSRITITLDLAPSDRSVRTHLSLYPRLVTRSQIAPLVDGVGITGEPLATTVSFTMRCRSHGPATFTLALYTTVPGRNPNPCTSRPPRLRLPCHAQSCDGVYPLSYTVTTNGATTTEWSMIAVQASPVATPLRVDLIETLGPAAWRQGARTVAVLSALAHFADVPVTLSADYRTLALVLATSSARATAWRSALAAALTSPLHRVLSAPPAGIDFAGLAAHGLTGAVTGQLSLAGQLLQTLNGRYVDGPVLVSGTPSLGDLSALAGAGVHDVILPENSLTVPPSTTLNWGAPFHVAGVASLTALATDQPLHQLMTTASIEPGRRAAMTLATLAFLHFEEPNIPASRTVVMSAPVAETPSTFVVDLLNGLAHNPFFVASSLVPSFNSSLIATNGAPDARTLAAAVNPPWSTRNVSTLSALSASITSYSQAVASKAVAAQLEVALAGTEIAGGATSRQSLITQASDALNVQLSKFSVDASAITLAGPGTALPITLFSRANYPVSAVVHLITDRLEFPKGKVLAVTLDSPTKSLRVPTASHQGSSLTLQVTVTTPDNRVVLAHAAIQVRIAGTSVVGYLLTFASLLVLALWWSRSFRHRSKGRHAR